MGKEEAMTLDTTQIAERASQEGDLQKEGTILQKEGTIHQTDMNREESLQETIIGEEGVAAKVEPEEQVLVILVKTRPNHQTEPINVKNSTLTCRKETLIII